MALNLKPDDPIVVIETGETGVISIEPGGLQYSSYGTYCVKLDVPRKTKSRVQHYLYCKLMDICKVEIT